MLLLVLDQTEVLGDFLAGVFVNHAIGRVVPLVDQFLNLLVV